MSVSVFLIVGEMCHLYTDTPDRTDAPSASTVIKGLYDARARGEP